MIGTEFLRGQGLGNRLFVYITARALAADRGAVFGTAGREHLRADHLDLDLGEEITDVSAYARYDEAEERIYLKNSVHDMVHGCYVAGADPALFSVADGTLIYGNLQAEAYFEAHRDELAGWLKVRPQYISEEYTADDLCILNVRGGEYADDGALFLREKYWRSAMTQMRRERPDMRFMVVTDDIAAAQRILPDVPAHHFSPEKDYVTVHMARYLILSNSSFGVLPAMTGPHVKKVIAPRYWARHNVSDGYWASAQNIYTGFDYLDPDGTLHTAEECRRGLASYLRDRMPSLAAHGPWQADDPEVKRTGARMELRRRLARAAQKLRRMRI